MILSTLLLVFSTHFSQSELEFEMSCDTYPYGVDASPMVKTVSGNNPRIDSINNDGLVGTLAGQTFKWNRRGKCLCNDINMDLIWSDLFYNYERK